MAPLFREGNAGARGPASAPPPPLSPPKWLVNGTEVTYRSTMLGFWGIAVRFAAMPLERLALIANSSKVKGQSAGAQFKQAAKLVVKDGWLASYRVVSTRSCIAWFLQYSVLGAAFEVSDRILSKATGLQPFVYGDALFNKDEEEDMVASSPRPSTEHVDPLHLAKTCTKAVFAPILASYVETMVSNKAEVERFYGKHEFKRLVTDTRAQRGILSNIAGPAFHANVGRNAFMSFATFIGAPVMFDAVFTGDAKTPENLAWFGLLSNLVINVFGSACQVGVTRRNIQIA